MQNIFLIIILVASIAFCYMSKGTFKKVFRDTLQKPNGKYDKQSIQMLTFTMMTILSGSFVVVSDYFLDKQINPYAIAVVGLFGTMASGQAVINVWNKKVDKTLNIDQNQE